MNTYVDSKNRVFDFMDSVKKEMDAKHEDDALKNSVNYKLKVLDKCKDDAKEVCLDNIFASIYRNAIPLNDDFKVAHAEDIDATFKDFIGKKCPKGIEYYVREGLKKGSPFAKKVLEAVDELVNDAYKDKALNIEDISVEELPFKTTDDIVVKIDGISNELSTPELSETIKNNVKSTALAEITKAKEEKENLKKLEEELKNDINVRTEEDINAKLEAAEITRTRDYKPTLFESVMINKTNKIQKEYDGGMHQAVNIYNTLEDYGKVTESVATVEELAFIEAVEEYTCLSMLKALKLESFNKYEVSDMIDSYSQERF